MSESCPSDSSGSTSTSEGEEPSPNLPSSRKRRRNVDKWKATSRKKGRNSGESYTSKAGKQVAGKTMNETPCGCALRCFEAVTLEQRKKIHSGFWGLGSFDIQNAFLCGSVKVLAVQRHYRSNSRRGNTRTYYVNNGERSVRVCKKAFLRIHGVSSGRVTRVLAGQAEQGGIPKLDRRGCHEPPNKTSEEDLAFIRQHIESFPVYESHYSRNDNPNRRYLSPDLSVSKMYHLYKEECTKGECRSVSDWVFRKIFNEEFNLFFGRPKTDTCKTCDSMQVSIEAETDPEVCHQLKGRLELHRRRAERAYQQLREDSALANGDPETDTITFDLQQSLPTPVLTTNVVYYKRQLWTYNLGIHCCGSGVGYMHMWNESQASRGSEDIGSCVLTYIKEHPTSAKKLIAYSDSCGGQNRNINIVCLWLHIVCSDEYSYTEIDHKFMISGHSYLPNDRDFGGIEKARRRSSAIFVPEDWCILVENARRVNPFQVRRMHQNDFVSTDKLTSMIVNRKVDVNGEKVDWLSIHWIRVEKTSPLQFKFRRTLNTLEEWKKVDLRPRRSGRPTDMGRVKLEPLYVARREIKPAKLKDLKELMCFVPPIHHAFYDSLTSAEDADD